MEGLGPVDLDALFSLPKDYWVEDAKEARKFLDDQVYTKSQWKGGRYTRSPVNWGGEVWTCTSMACSKLHTANIENLDKHLKT